jgi:hypothetical protein
MSKRITLYIINLLKYRGVTNSNDMTVSQEMVRGYVEHINILTNVNCSVKRANNAATIRNGYLLNSLLDIYLKKMILGLYNDVTNSSDCMKLNAVMIHWKGCGKKRSYAVLRYCGYHLSGQMEGATKHSKQESWFRMEM